MLIGAIADDLTGATDLSLILAREGLDVVQVVGVPEQSADFGGAEAVVVALKSRTIPADEAVAQSLASAEVLLARGAEKLFFKYCSTFDSTDEGNIGPVTDALLRLLGEERTIACPAFPTNGRSVYMGYLFVGEQLLSESSMKDHPLTPMRDANLVRVLQRQTARPVSLIARRTVAAGADAIAERLATLEGIAIVDAVDDLDLRAIGAAAARTLKLVTGGSALAMGLVPSRPRGDASTALAAPAGGAVSLAGSCSAATRRQIEAARAAGVEAMQVDPEAIAAGKVTTETALRFVLDAQGGALPPLVYSSADPEHVAAAQQKLGTGKAGEVVEHFLGDLARRLSEEGVARFIVAGGETSGAVVAALGVSALRIGPEIDPGVPWTLTQGRAQPLALALKSGNFGADDFFVKAWRLLD